MPPPTGASSILTRCDYTVTNRVLIHSHRSSRMPVSPVETHWEGSCASVGASQPSIVTVSIVTPADSRSITHLLLVVVICHSSALDLRLVSPTSLRLKCSHKFVLIGTDDIRISLRLSQQHRHKQEIPRRPYLSHFLFLLCPEVDQAAAAGHKMNCSNSMHVQRVKIQFSTNVPPPVSLSCQ